MNELATPKHVILMKSGLTLLVEPATATRITDHITSQASHSFIKISELGQVINSAEIDGIYTPEKYEELLRMKGGEYKCAYNKWHKKKAECDCREEARRAHDRFLKEDEMKKESAPLTPEEQKKRAELIEKYRFGAPRTKTADHAGPTLRRSKLVEYEMKHGTPYQYDPAIYSVIEDAP